jgi:F-type H+-transporting ATPase subunit a
MDGQSLRGGEAGQAGAAGRARGRWRLVALALLGTGLATGAAWAGEEHKGAGHGEAPKAEGKAAGAHEAKHDAKHETHEKHDPLEHVMDSSHWEFFPTAGLEIHLPDQGPFRRLTKFMILEVIAAALVAAIYIPLARRMASGQTPSGAWDNTFEVLLTFVRDQIARPALTPPEDEGHGHEAGHAEAAAHAGAHHDEHHGAEAPAHAPPAHDAYVPFLWTLFLFILFNNLLGMFPFGGSATASIYVTGALALIVFFAIHGCAVARMGLGPYLKSLWPHIDVPFPMNFLITPVVCVIELIGTLVRNAVLAVRLFANMFAGHMVLAVILGFIVLAKTTFALWFTVTVSSVLGIVAMSLLEIFVAFLQAYIFTFLTALFIGMAMYPSH